MKRNLALTVFVAVFVGVVLAGCGPIVEAPVTGGPLSEQEKQWLGKGYRYDKDGWIFVHIEGGAFERGFQRGYLTANEIDEFRETLGFLAEFWTAKEPEFFTKKAGALFKKKVSNEYAREMRGMAAGMCRAGKETTYEQMLFMNGFIEMLWYWWPQEKKQDGPGCSAFIATGDATSGGQIVMAHNSWTAYAILRFCNVLVEIFPDEGNRILMQSWGPCIYSATDFFITSAHLVGTETTIGGFGGFDKKGTPVFERARRAMQYADTIDEWAQIMIKNNSGAYANSWLLGDIESGEIARLELGLKNHRLEKKTNGYFSGSNITEDIKILRQETDAVYDDIRSGAISRRERWKQLLNNHYGKIDVELAKEMLADHYDVYLEQEKPSSRTICGHYELDDGSVPNSRQPYRPAGAVDGKVVDSGMAKNWRFWARWGSSCDIGFDAEQFLGEHPQYDWLDGYLKDLPAEPWTVFPGAGSE